MSALHDWSPEEVRDIKLQISEATSKEDLHGRIAQFLLNLRCPPLFVYMQQIMKDLRERDCFVEAKAAILAAMNTYIEETPITWTRGKS